MGRTGRLRPKVPVKKLQKEVPLKRKKVERKTKSSASGQKKSKANARLSKKSRLISQSQISTSGPWVMRDDDWAAPVENNSKSEIQENTAKLKNGYTPRKVKKKSGLRVTACRPPSMSTPVKAGSSKDLKDSLPENVTLVLDSSADSALFTDAIDQMDDQTSTSKADFCLYVICTT